jgi:phospholipid transport system substrate-binding protein
MLATRIFAGLAFLLAVAAAPLTPAAAADAGQFLSDIGNRTIRLISDKQRPEEQRRQEFEQLAERSFDVPWIARFVLGRYWKTASPAEREQFTEAFRAYMVRVYWSRFSQYAGIDLKVVGQHPLSDGTIAVQTTVTRVGEDPAKVDWIVAKEPDGAFKIRDASLEGISQTLTYRQEFASVIERNSGQVSALVDELRRKTRG